jgi:hypothetical protein
MLIFDINIKVYEIIGKKSLEKEQYVIHLGNFLFNYDMETSKSNRSGVDSTW